MPAQRSQRVHPHEAGQLQFRPWSTAARTFPEVEAVGDSGASVFIDVKMHAVKANEASRSRSNLFDNAENVKRDIYEAFAQERCATFVPLLMEVDGVWAESEHKYLNSIILRYAIKQSMTAAASTIYWRR